MTAADPVRQRLLEGVLLRLAGRPEAETLVLRGGLLLREWFRPLERPVDDVDLVALTPLDVDGTAGRLLPVLAADGVGDGVSYDTEVTRWQGIWLATGTPGVRLFVIGSVGGQEQDFNVDVTFGPFPRPAPVAVDLPTLFGTPARVRACRPEAVAGHKAQALWHRGRLGWRPKDLDDLRLLLERMSMDHPALAASVFAYLADAGGTPADAREMFRQPWWGHKSAAARWRDHADARPGTPRDLRAIVETIADRLVPILEGGA